MTSKPSEHLHLRMMGAAMSQEMVILLAGGDKSSQV